MTQHSATLPPPGISGKRVTIWVIVSLVVIVGSLSYTLWSYNRIDAARAQSAIAWRTAIEPLAQRYRASKLGVTEGVAKGETSEAFSQQFHSAVDTFLTTSIVQEQVSAAERIEELLHSAEFPTQARQALQPATQLQNEVDEYNQRRQRELALLKTPGGRILDIFLDFPNSQPFQLTRD